MLPSMKHRLDEDLASADSFLRLSNLSGICSSNLLEERRPID